MLEQVASLNYFRFAILRIFFEQQKNVHHVPREFSFGLFYFLLKPVE